MLERPARTWGRLLILCSAVFAIALAAGAASRAEVAAATVSSDGSLRLVSASRTVREVSVTASPVSGSALAVLQCNGTGVATQTVAPADTAEAVRFDHVAVASSSCTFTVTFLNAGGAELAQTPSLLVLADSFVPPAPSALLKKNSVVGPAPVIRGMRHSSTATMTVLVNGESASSRSVSTTATVFALSVAKMPYQKSFVKVRAVNAWGFSDSPTYRVWNLGRTPKRKTYIVVDKSECRLYYVKNSVFVKRFSVAIGTPRTPTPTGEFVITKKHKNKKPYGGLGAYWLRLEKITNHGLKFSGYFIHGTSWKRVIGRAGSLGCVDMLDSQIVRFGPTVPVKTHVLIRK